MTIRYVGSDQYAAVTQWSSGTPTVGLIRRPVAPAAGSERVYRCTTSVGYCGTEPGWNTGAGLTTTDLGSNVWTEVTGTAWTAPHATLGNCFASGWSLAGDTVYISNWHSTLATGALTLTSPGTHAAPVHVLCVNPSTGLLATGAAINTDNGIALNMAGSAIYYGINFSLGNNGATNTTFTISSDSAVSLTKLIDCSIRNYNTGSSSSILIGLSTGDYNKVVEFINTPLRFGATGQGILVKIGDFVWRDTESAINASGTIPTTLCSFMDGAAFKKVEFSGLDLTAYTLAGGKSIFNAGKRTSGIAIVKNCRIASGFVNWTTGSFTGWGMQVFVENCGADSPTNGYNLLSLDFGGTVQSSKTVYKNSGGNDGQHDYSLKMVSSANVSSFLPLVSRKIVSENVLTGSAMTVSVGLLQDSIADLTSADIWLEVEAFTTTGYPIGKVYGGHNTTLAAATLGVDTTLSAGIADDTTTWTSSGLTHPRSQIMTVTLPTVQEPGVLQVKVCLAKASATVYIDPGLVVT